MKIVITMIITVRGKRRRVSGVAVLAWLCLLATYLEIYYMTAKLTDVVIPQNRPLGAVY